KIHRETSAWFPRLVEAAYRGELAKLKRVKTDTKDPHLPISEIAEDHVAEVAGITRSQVHQLCQQLRDDLAEAARAAAARPSRGVERDAPMTAADLKRHLSSLFG